MVLIKVSRDVKEYHMKLDNCAELLRYRQDLADAGKNFKLVSGAKCFVRPDQYDAVLKAVSDQSLKNLGCRHLLVSQDYEKVVTNVIESITCNSKVHWQSRMDVEISASFLKVQRIFIHIDVESSLRSSSGGRPYVASSTEAHRGRNPRRT